MVGDAGVMAPLVNRRSAEVGGDTLAAGGFHALPYGVGARFFSRTPSALRGGGTSRHCLSPSSKGAFGFLVTVTRPGGRITNPLTFPVIG